MRKMFQLGGALGLCFTTDNIDLSMFKEKPLAAYLPDGRIAKLQSIELVFHKPDFSNIFDMGAHRASIVNFVFCDAHDEKTSFEASGAYFWRFLESVPEPFRILSDDKQNESYINESLQTVMMVARHLYQSCFIDTTTENSCPPPLTCMLDLESYSFDVVEPITLPIEERSIISSIINLTINALDLTVFVTEFVDNMLVDGYLIHKFKSVEGGVIPDFTPANWDKTKHKVARDYLSELSSHPVSDNCPAYTRWSEFLNKQLKELVNKLFNELFTIDKLKDRSDLTCAQAIIKSNGDLFEIQGANESVDIVSNRVIIAMGQYLESLDSRH
ncbi:MAG: hypothetical protein HAW67_01290 [Endozoicomonadaceae bacterium]|nr:hypothetical protein [Endozoicomonadaceae bacterium]